MNPSDRHWYESIGIPLTRTQATRYVYAIEPATDAELDSILPDAVESLSLSPKEETPS